MRMKRWIYPMALVVLLISLSGMAQGAGSTGYIDTTGALTFSGDWSFGWPFDENGLARVFSGTMNAQGYGPETGTYAFLDTDGKQVGHHTFADAGSFQHGLAWVQQQGLYGYLNLEGNLAITPQWTYATPFTAEGAAVVFAGEQAKEKYHIIDREGTLLSPEGWDKVEPFIEGYAVASRGGKYTHINQQGAPIAPAQWDYAAPFGPEGFAPVFIGQRVDGFPGEGQWGFVNTQGLLVGQVEWDAVEDFHQGLALVKRDGLYGYLNTTGTLALELQWPIADSFTQDGLARVAFLQPGDNTLAYGHIDKHGRPLGTGRWQDVGAFTFGMAWVQQEDQYGFINQAGDVVFAPQWSHAGDFDENGIAPVFIESHLDDGTPEGGGYGLVRSDGSVLTPPQWQSVSYPSQGRILVQREDRYGFLNLEGEQEIPPQWDIAEGFDGNQVARVYKGALDADGAPTEDGWGFIDLDGQLLGGRLWQAAADGGEGLLCVQEDGLYGFMNLAGELVIEPQYQSSAFFENGYAFVHLPPK